MSISERGRSPSVAVGSVAAVVVPQSGVTRHVGACARHARRAHRYAAAIINLLLFRRIYGNVASDILAHRHRPVIDWPLTYSDSGHVMAVVNSTTQFGMRYYLI